MKRAIVVVISLLLCIAAGVLAGVTLTVLEAFLVAGLIAVYAGVVKAHQRLDAAEKKCTTR